MSTLTATTRELKTAPGSPLLAHIVGPDRCRANDACSHGGPCGGQPRDGATIALEARVTGSAVTALCGHVLVPSRDSRTLPTCAKCLAVFRRRTGEPDASRCQEA